MIKKIHRVIDASKTIIKDCSLENGGIVAANSTKKHFPAAAKNYFYIWPRDASYACIAADILELDKLQENFFNWCLNRAEGFRANGLFYDKYYPNGLKALPRIQPDQSGTVLLAVWHHFSRYQPDIRKSVYEELVVKTADGICSLWEKDHFIENVYDLWEERVCFPDLRENFSYSLASCIRGLQCANDLIPDGRWSRTAQEMKSRLDRHCLDYFVRSFGEITDKRIDASVLGLVYPFELYDARDARIIATLNEIEEKLSVSGGIHRYEHDEYDGWMQNGVHRKKGAGAWPLLNFWLAICFQRKGDPDKANYYYEWVLDRIKDDHFIPEQMFGNDIQVSVSPLLWSHAMFILASKELNFI